MLSVLHVGNREAEVVAAGPTPPRPLSCCRGSSESRRSTDRSQRLSLYMEFLLQQGDFTSGLLELDAEAVSAHSSTSGERQDYACQRNGVENARLDVFRPASGQAIDRRGAIWDSDSKRGGSA